MHKNSPAKYNVISEKKTRINQNTINSKNKINKITTITRKQTFQYITVTLNIYKDVFTHTKWGKKKIS